MASLSGEFNFQAFTDAGAPLASGRVYTYTAGTTTKKTVYTDAAGSVAHTYVSDGAGGEYIALNSRGELPSPLFLASGAYDITLKRSDGTTVWTRRASGLDLTESITAYGVTPGSSADQATLIQSAIDAVAEAGGGRLTFPGGTYRARNLWARDNVTLIGESFGSVILKLPDNVDGQLLGNENASSGDSIDFFGVENIIFDGNKASAAGVTASSAVAVNIVTHFYAKNCVFRNATGYGLAFQAYPLGSSVGAQTRIYLENCYLLDNGDGVGGDTFDGLDIKDCFSVTLVSCTAKGNSDRGFNIRGEDVNLIACYAEANGLDGSPGLTAGFEIVGNSDPATVATTARLVLCESRLNGGAGFSFANGNGAGTQLVRVNMADCMSFSNGAHGVEVSGTSTFVELTAKGLVSSGNTNHGVSLSSSTRSAQISGRFRSNGGSGIYTNMTKAAIHDVEIISNTSYGIEEGASATRTVVSGSCVINTNTAGNFLWNANGRRHVGREVVDYDTGSSDIIASANTITLPEGGEVFFVTGTTTINTVTAGRRGRVVTLHFTGSLTVTHAAGNLRLAAGANKTTANLHQLTLACDGTSWFEVGYSANT